MCKRCKLPALIQHQTSWFWRLKPMAIWAMLATLSCSLTAQADDKFIFGVNAPGSPPYLYMLDGNPNYRGVINDVLEQLGRTKNLHIEYVDSFRVRTEKFLYDGKLTPFSPVNAGLPTQRNLFIACR